MHDYKVERIDRYKNHIVLNLESRNERDKIRFTPGQYAAISFKKHGRWSPVRCFTIVSNKNEDLLQFAMRPNGLFTSNVAKLKPGTKVRVQGPYGSFTIDEEYDERIIMLAGGIGITPFISMLRHAKLTRLAKPITLLYACKSIDDLPFYDELIALTEQVPNFKVYFFISNGMGDSIRNIHARSLDADALSKVTRDQYDNYTYFICGPQSFNESFSELLRSKNINKDQIVTESFAQADSMSFEVSNLSVSIPRLTYGAVALSLVIGFGFFMSIDLIRYLPKVKTVSSKLNSSSNGSSNTGQNTANGSQSTSGSNTSGTTNSSNSTSNQSQTYQAPVSSVS